ncbi:hypothetical protein E2C01_050284 [Portunus trituberculatus]|uniref:Uncharacterized protein n=1 Tax=Portunus trituberculatus TaxID=210409 RepID=A0A5B7GFP7_PORTR|nr:hypothetical protein [Portunus trituberculatus]
MLSGDFDTLNEHVRFGRTAASSLRKCGGVKPIKMRRPRGVRRRADGRESARIKANYPKFTLPKTPVNSK